MLNGSGSEDQQALFFHAPGRVNLEPEMCLRFAIRAVGKLSGRLLKSNKRHPVPLRQKAQVRIAVEWSLMAKFS
jgi:hypothetical protein